MKKIYRRFFIIWTVYLCFSFLSCPNDTTSNNKSTLNVDLVVASISVPGTLQTTGDTWTLGARISNTDPITDAGTSTLKYYLSEDNILNIHSDPLIGSKGIEPIAAGNFVDDVWSGSYSINQGGIWYIFAVADATFEVTENNEENNILGKSVAIIFDRIVIETFSPTGKSIDDTDTYLSLFDSAGDQTPGTPYNDSDAMAANWLGNSNHNWYSRIDTDVDMGRTGLAPGTYYIKVRGAISDKTGPYGIRVATDPAAAYSYFGATNPVSDPNTVDDSYENDDPMTGSIPDNPLSIKLNVQENWHNRTLIESDIDWFILQLN